MRVWLTTTETDRANFFYTFELVERIQTLVREQKGHRFLLADSPAQADLIVFIESPNHKFRDYAHRLLQNELIRQYPNKCFAYDFEDGPAPFLPGAYPSLRRAQYDPNRTRSCGYVMNYNVFATEYAKQRTEKDPSLLFSFRGAASADVRKTLFAGNFENAVVEQTNSWFNHGDDELRRYLDLILDSKFCLCPRGVGTASNRITEVMMLGRPPVILADEWMPPVGPDWQNFALIIAEDKVAELPTLLAQYEPYWREMGEAARRAYEQWLAPEIAPLRMLGYLEEIWLRRDASHDEKAYQDRWLTWSFAWEQGWTLPQGLATSLRDGTFSKRVRSRLMPKQTASTA